MRLGRVAKGVVAKAGPAGLAGLAVAGALAAAVLLGAAPAAATGDGAERISDMSVTFDVRADGSMHVTETITYDFGTALGRHGIERVIPVKFGYDSDSYRLYPLTYAKASSPSGAPADLQIENKDVVRLRVGDASRVVAGVQTYRIEYDLAGVVNTVAGGQELYWNALGLDSLVPVARATVTVTGPGAAVQRATCFEGPDKSTEPCTWSVSGGRATFTAMRALAPHEGLTVVAGFPAGTFPSAAPILQEKWSLARAYSVREGGGPLGLLVALGFAGGTGLVAAVRGRDRRYLDVTPGLTPVAADGRKVRIGWVSRRTPVAVQFTPPRDLRVAELGTLLDEGAHVRHVSATVIDLAVRGYLRIEVRPADDAPTGTANGEGGRPVEWALVRTTRGTPRGLRPYEKDLFEAIFADHHERPTLSDLGTAFGSVFPSVTRQLNELMIDEGWFRTDPRAVRATWVSRAGTVATVGLGLTVLLTYWGHLALVGVGVMLGGGAMYLLARRMPARTADGTALLAQVRGFRLYLETAEADQIRFEEGIDVFSRYLPYAIVFGVAQRWADVFARLAASGRPLPPPTWYVGDVVPGQDGFDYHRFGDSVDSFSDRTSAVVASGGSSSSVSSSSGITTSSSSGGSGFSDGSSGGGGGGGGVGSW